MKRDSSGFSLLELLIVVAIILIIATIAIPNLLRSRQQANETAAVATLRSINSAQIVYLSSAGRYTDINQLVAEGILPPLDRTGGYQYRIELATDSSSYTAVANPSSISAGRWAYYTTPQHSSPLRHRYGVDAARAWPAFPSNEFGLG